METSAISYRVADFLKQHPPFNAIEEKDLVGLAAFGRVRFFEANEFLMWQGEPHKAHIYVIQQGTVSLWDEHGGRAELRDVRGAGDLIGGEQFHGERACLYTAQATSDVVIYGFPAEDFAALLERYPYAAKFVAALGTVTTDFQRTDEQADPRRMFLHQVAGAFQTCSPATTVSEAARLLARSGRDAMAVVEGETLRGTVSANALLLWLADGGRGDRPVSDLRVTLPPTVGPDATVTDGVLAMGTAEVPAVAMTADGTAAGRLLSILTPRDVVPAFGDQPALILRDIRRAGDIPALRALNQRARACALQHLTSAASVDWILQFTDAVDVGILKRLLVLTAQDDAAGCWCVCGASGRGESISMQTPHVILIHDPRADGPELLAAHARAIDGLGQCGYLAGLETPYPATFYAATAAEWTRRYTAWIQHPVIEGMERSRALFDLRPFHGQRRHWERVRDGVTRAVDRDIIRILAHDCLADLPPLTFYEDAVVEHSGEMTTVFRLDRNALQPLVDLGRVFGMAVRDVMGTSTLERFAEARRRLPAHETIFREASEALRIVLWEQGRIGISQGTTGSELPPKLLSRHDRHLLKSGFPAIQRLLEFAATAEWLDAIE